MEPTELNDELKKSSRSNGRFVFSLFGVGILALFLGIYSWTYQRNQPLDEPLISHDFGDGETDVVPIEEFQSLGGVEVGAAAPDFTLFDLEGNEISLSDFVGQPVIVNFWAEWCAPCRFEMPDLQAAFEEHQDDGLVILAVNQADPPDVLRQFFYDEMGLTFTPLLDDQLEVAVEYGAFRTLPTTVFVTPEGTVSRLHRGPLNKTLLDTFLEGILPQS